MRLALSIILISLVFFPLGIFSYPLRTIIIDPGHGGRDPGAVSGDKNPIMEKNINLEIAKELEKLLKAKLPKIRVVLTRNGDFFVSLGERAKIANQFLENSAIFISIHTNSHAQVDKPLRGVEVFYHYNSNDTIADFRRSEYRYRMEDSPIHDDKLEQAIEQLMNSKAKEDGKNLAQYVAEGIHMASQEPIRRIAQSNLYVVSYGIIPSVLVEVGFIGNNDKLKNKSYLKRLAKGILLGILSYMMNEKTV